MIQQKELKLSAYKRGFHLITHIVEDAIDHMPEQGLLNIFIKHTSAGICINENASPDVKIDMETSFNRLVPEGNHLYTHTSEGPDDMPAHVKQAFTGCSLTIPIAKGRLALGTWQGIYLCEFRNYGGNRKLLLTIYS